MSTIDTAKFTSELNTVFKKYGFSGLLTRERADAFAALTERMLTVNETFNLTAVTEPGAVLRLHYLDCAFPASKIPKGASVLDVGTGAGFPALPLAILRPDLKITAADSTEKRVRYVEETAKMLGLSNLKTVVMRAEDGGRDPALRESFDVVISRAVAEMRTLAELSLPFVKVGGQFLAMKGKNAQYELQDAKRALAMLGGKTVSVEDFSFENNGETVLHPLITVKKIAPTPAAYPRPFAQISKKPL